MSKKSSSKVKSNKSNKKWIIDQNILGEIIKEADKVPTGLMHKTILIRIMSVLTEKTPFSESDLRRICKVGLLRYERANELPLQKISLLESEERIEILTKLHGYFVKIFEEVLGKSPDRLKSQLTQQLDNYFGIHNEDFTKI
jgi:hypothetical protein